MAGIMYEMKSNKGPHVYRPHGFAFMPLQDFDKIRYKMFRVKVYKWIPFQYS
jgi:hypothetical protein